MFSWFRRSSAPATDHDPVSQALRLIDRARDKCRAAEICRFQSDCLEKSFAAVAEYLQLWRLQITSLSGAMEELMAVVEKGIELVRSCKKSGWVIRTLLRGESRQEFAEMHYDLFHGMQLVKVSFSLGEVQALSQPSEFIVAADRDLRHLCDLTSELQNMLQTMLMGNRDREVLPKELLIHYGNMKLVKHLGHGAYGTVYEAVWNNNVVNNVVAVKVLRGGMASHELKVASFKHPNIVSVIGYSIEEDNEQHCIIMEKMDNDLNWAIKKQMKYSRGNPPFELKRSISIMLQVAKGMRFLHANNVIHRDLKPENILIADHRVSDWVVKIGDFGTSRTEFDTAEGIASPNQGTAGFRAPEVYRSQTYSRAADVFSYGMTCYNILTGKRPLEEVELARQRDLEIRHGQRPGLHDEWHANIKSLLQKCWHEDPSERPGFHEICEILYPLKLVCT